MKCLCSAGYAKEGRQAGNRVSSLILAQTISCFALLVLLMGLIQHPVFTNCFLHWEEARAFPAEGMSVCNPQSCPADGLCSSSQWDPTGPVKPVTGYNWSHGPRR